MTAGIHPLVALLARLIVEESTKPKGDQDDNRTSLESDRAHSLVRPPSNTGDVATRLLIQIDKSNAPLTGAAKGE